MIEPSKKQYVQFSKKVTIAVTVMWGFFRLITLILIAFKPEVSDALTVFQKGVDDVMMVAIGFYAGNSVAEKGILGYFGAKKKSASDYYMSEEENCG